jgi:HSP20 family molecular chaperone IbpA
MYFIRKYNNKSLLDEMNSVFGGGFSKLRDMKTDIEETDKEYKLSIEVPGYNKDDISITCDKGYLTIHAINSKESDTKKEYIRKERYTSSIQRTYYLGDVNEDGIKAKLDSGILDICVPKAIPLPENTKRILVE